MHQANRFSAEIEKVRADQRLAGVFRPKYPDNDLQTGQLRSRQIGAGVKAGAEHLQDLVAAVLLAEDLRQTVAFESEPFAIEQPQSAVSQGAAQQPRESIEQPDHAEMSFQRGQSVEQGTDLLGVGGSGQVLGCTARLVPTQRVQHLAGTLANWFGPVGKAGEDERQGGGVGPMAQSTQLGDDLVVVRAGRLNLAVGG